MREPKHPFFWQVGFKLTITWLPGVGHPSSFLLGMPRAVACGKFPSEDGQTVPSTPSGLTRPGLEPRDV